MPNLTFLDRDFYDKAIKYNNSQVFTPEEFVRLVYAAQQRYNEANKDLPPLLEDGKYGPKTRKALANWMGKYGPAFPAWMVHPMRYLPDGRTPRVTSSFRHPLRPKHDGVDLFYQYLPGYDPQMKVGDGGRTDKWWVPDGATSPYGRAYAVADGKIVMASKRPSGFRVWLDIGDYSVGYFHLSYMAVKVGDTVKAADLIGWIGHNPNDTDARHLHLEVHEGDLDKYPAGLIDPEIMLSKCQRWT